MAKREQVWVSKVDQTLSGRSVRKGQLIQPVGGRNDRIIFGDNTRWAYRYDGTTFEVCGTDGCESRFDNLGSLQRHREMDHKSERDDRERARLQRLEAAKQAEEQGDTIGGHEVIDVKKGPHGPVPYIQPLGR